MPSANLDLIRAINQFNILNSIRIRKAVSRSEIADITGQSRASVTTITAQMIEKGLIFEKNVEVTGERGRNRVLLALNPDAAYVVGVKLAATKASSAVCDMQGETRSAVIRNENFIGKDVGFIEEYISELILAAVNEAGLSLENISGIGIGVPGVVDFRTGICHWSPLYDAGNVPLRDRIQNRFNIKTYIENDANTLTLAHQWFGEGRGVDNFIVLSIEYGVGMGIITNGQLYRGVRGFAGEMGHVPVTPDGELCVCGKKGCLATVVGGMAFINKAKRLSENGLWVRQSTADIEYEEVIDAAKQGEKALIEIVHAAGHCLGVGVSVLINIFNPEKIIISGQGVEAGEIMFNPMFEAVNRHTFSDLLAFTKIVIPEWQHTDWAKGAASLVLQELYKSPFNTVRPLI
jgi:predicted NBD/HSP70 family sugar kinase